MKLPADQDRHQGRAQRVPQAVGVRAGCLYWKWVQVDPTGLVHPSEPDAKVKLLAHGWGRQGNQKAMAEARSSQVAPAPRDAQKLRAARRFRQPWRQRQKVMEDFGLKKTQVDKVPEGAAVDQGLRQHQGAKLRFQHR